MAVSKAKLLYWSKRCIETIESGMAREMEKNVGSRDYIKECEGKIHTHKLLREHLLSGVFED